MGVQLEQAGFQAVARGCIEQSQGMELLEEMKVCSISAGSH